MSKRSIARIAAIVVFAGVSWFGLKQYRCKQRNAAFAQRVESIKQDAREGLTIGTKKGDVAGFFVEHSIPFTIYGSDAFGSLRTSGCAPFGCGTDSALIGVRVKLDEEGTVIEEPTVSGLYADCL